MLVAGVKDELILYYTSSDWCGGWPRIPHNLTLFSLDDCKRPAADPSVFVRSLKKLHVLDRPPGVDVSVLAQVRQERLAAAGGLRE